MWFLRNDETTQEPDIVHISSRVDKSWINEQVLQILTQYGLAYNDTKPEEKRADMEFLRRMRTGVERSRTIIFASLMKALIASIITLIGWGLLHYFGQSLKGLTP